jgi:large subunit ribosomal protein L10
MPSKVKQLMVDELCARFDTIDRTGCIVLECRGLKAHDSYIVRTRLSEQGARMMMVRNALFSIAMERLGVKGIDSLLGGPSAIVVGQDPVSAAKAARQVVSGVKGLTVRGGYVEGHVLDGAGVERLAGLPGRETLLSQALSCMVAPAQKFVNAMSAALGQMACLFEELRKQKAQAAGDSQQGAGE